MSRQGNISARQGNRRCAAVIPEPIAALNAPLRVTELEAMGPGRTIGSIDQPDSGPDVHLTGLAMKSTAALLDVPARLGPRDSSMTRSPISQSSEALAVHVHGAKSVNPVPEADRRHKTSAGLNLSAALRAQVRATERKTMGPESREFGFSYLGSLRLTGIP